MAVDTSQFVDIYKSTYDRIGELDEILDAASDQKSAGRRSVVNSLSNNVADQVADPVQSFISQLADKPEDFQYGFFFAFTRALKKEYEEKALAYADSLVAERPQVSVNPEEVEVANNERSDKITQLTHLFAIIEMVDPEGAATLPKVPRRRSLGGPRGKRAISFYTWTKDGVAFEGTLTQLAKVLGYEKGVDLRNEMKAAEINLSKPPVEIKFTTSGGVELIGTRSADAPDFDSPDTEDEEDDEDDDEDEDEEVTEAEESISV